MIIVNLVDDAIVCGSDSIEVGQPFELLTASRTWRDAQGLDLSEEAPLIPAWERLKGLGRGWFELDPVGHELEP